MVSLSFSDWEIRQYKFHGVAHIPLPDARYSGEAYDVIDTSPLKSSAEGQPVRAKIRRDPNNPQNRTLILYSAKPSQPSGRSWSIDRNEELIGITLSPQGVQLAYRGR